MKKVIALIFPGITFSGFKKNRNIESSWLHHGLASISAMLKSHGHIVKLIDLRQLSGWNEFKDKITDPEIDIFGITVMSVDRSVAVRCAQIIKDSRPDVPIVAGGPHISILPEDMGKEHLFDALFLGESEKSFLQWVNELPNSPKGFIPSIPLEDLDELPWIDRNLFNADEEPIVPFLPRPFVTLIAGRGCRYNCSFCQPAERLIFGKKVKRRSVENVIGELKELHVKSNFQSFMIHDDCLTEDVEWVTKFCNYYKSEGFKQGFAIQSRADTLVKNELMVKTWAKIGLKMLIIGFESGSDRALKILRKGTTREINLKAAKICHKYGIKIWANYMLGIPTETKEEALSTYSMLKEIRPYHCSPSLYTPHPGSDLYKKGEASGWHIDGSAELMRRDNYSPKIKNMDYKFLKRILYKSSALGEDQNRFNKLVKTYFPVVCIDALKYAKKSFSLTTN